MRHIIFIWLLSLTPFVEGRPAQQLSSYPFISSSTFACFADHGNNLGKSRPGDIVYVDNFSIKNFFRNIHPRINAPYILISHNGWPSIPGTLAQYLDDPKLIAWFGKNIDRNHPKLHPLPIGLVGINQPEGNINIVKAAIADAPPSTSRSTEKLVYMNMTIRCNPKERGAALNALREKEFCQFSERKPFPQYIKELSQFRFVASPNGLGIDCHRTWEAMLVGTIPIVTRSSIVELFDDLPVLIIDNWSQVTREFLEQKFEEITSKSYNLKKLYADYWFEQIRKIQQKYRT